MYLTAVWECNVWQCAVVKTRKDCLDAVHLFIFKYEDFKAVKHYISRYPMFCLLWEQLEFFWKWQVMLGMKGMEECKCKPFMASSPVVVPLLTILVCWAMFICRLFFWPLLCVNVASSHGHILPRICFHAHDTDTKPTSGVTCYTIIMT